MLKKMIISAALILAMSAAAQAAEFYDDLEILTGYTELKDGCTYMYASPSEINNYAMSHLNTDFEKFGIGIKFDDDTVTLRRSGRELVFTPDVPEGMLDGERYVFKHTPYSGRDGKVFIPLREVVELFGGRIMYRDLGYTVNKVLAFYGEDMYEVSGAVGDSYNNWTLTLPEGFYCMTDSVDSDKVYICDFDGISLKIAMGGEWGMNEPLSVNLDSYLMRREIYHNDNSSSYYSDYLVEGVVYTAPTQEKRDKLNRIIDSFKPQYTEGAKDLSYANADRSAWDYNNKRLGIAFDMPIKWDTDGGRLHMKIYTPYENPPRFNAGFSYGSMLHMSDEVCRGITAKELTEESEKKAEYYSAALPEMTETVIEGRVVYLSEHEIEVGGNSRIQRDYLVDDGKNTHVISFYVYDTNAEHDAVCAEMEAVIPEVMRTIRLSEPTADIAMYERLDRETEEFEFEGLKFDVPKSMVCINAGESMLIFAGMTPYVTAPFYQEAAGGVITVTKGAPDGAEIGEEEIEALKAQEGYQGEIELGGRRFYYLKETAKDFTGNSYEGYFDAEGGILILKNIHNTGGEPDVIKDLDAVIASIH